MNELLKTLGDYLIEKNDGKHLYPYQGINNTEISLIQDVFDIKSRGTVLQAIKQLHTVGLLDDKDNIILSASEFDQKMNEYSKNFPDITIDRGLVHEENEKAVKTRVPGTYDANIRFVWLSKDNITEINNGKTLLTCIDLDQKYKLYDNDGKVTEITGKNLYSHYDPVVNEVKNKVDEMSELSQESVKNENPSEKESQSDTLQRESVSNSVSDREINRIISDIDRYKDEMHISGSSVSNLDEQYQKLTAQLNDLQAEVEMLRNKGIKNSLRGAVKYMKDGVLSSRENFLTSADKAIEGIKSKAKKDSSTDRQPAANIADGANSARKEIQNTSKVSTAVANNIPNISANIPMQSNDAERLIVIQELLKAILKTLLGLENSLSSIAENINQRTADINQQANRSQQTALIQIHGLYRHYNGSEMIHYSIEQNGKRTDCLTMVQ